MNTTDLLTLARACYDRYRAPWWQSYTPQQVIAATAAAMGMEGCSATFVERKCVVRAMIEKGREDESVYR